MLKATPEESFFFALQLQLNTCNFTKNNTVLEVFSTFCNEVNNFKLQTTSNIQLHVIASCLS